MAPRAREVAQQHGLRPPTIATSTPLGRRKVALAPRHPSSFLSNKIRRVPTYPRSSRWYRWGLLPWPQEPARSPSRTDSASLDRHLYSPRPPKSDSSTPISMPLSLNQSPQGPYLPCSSRCYRRSLVTWPQEPARSPNTTDSASLDRHLYSPTAAVGALTPI